MEQQLGKRERQIMDVIYRLGRATVAEVQEALSDPPSYSAVRGMLRFLEEKGLLRHEQDGIRYVYLPTVVPKKARKSALRHLVQTFFSGSPQEAAAALIEEGMSDEEMDRLAALLAQARKEGR
jgi:predicted transcriptional regulator